MSNLRPVIFRILLGVAAISGLIWHQYITSEIMDLSTAIANTYVKIYLVVGATIGLITLSLNKASAWSALTKEYPIEGHGNLLTNDHAIGILNLDSPEAPTPVKVATTLAQSGILVCESRKELLADAMFLLPWERIIKLSVSKPKSYDRFSSEEELESKHQHLRAQLHISRGRFPPHKLEIPWTYKFNATTAPLIENGVVWN